MRKQRVTLVDLLAGHGPALLGTGETADFLDVDPRTLARPEFRQKLGLARRRIGGRWKYLSLDVLRAVDNAKQEPRP